MLSGPLFFERYACMPFPICQPCNVHEDVRFCSSDDSVHVTECGGVLELHHSRMCIILVAVESGEFVHLDLNCNNALSLGISHINPRGRSKRQVDRLSRPKEHCHFSSLQH